jgi:hypothetical protein
MTLGDRLAVMRDGVMQQGEGKEGELWLDTAKLHLFDPDSGERLQL